MEHWRPSKLRRERLLLRRRPPKTQAKASLGREAGWQMAPNCGPKERLREAFAMSMRMKGLTAPIESSAALPTDFHSRMSRCHWLDHLLYSA